MADDGSADPVVSQTLAAYAAGEASERAALTALATSRLLVPVVAVLAEEPAGAEERLRRPRQAGPEQAGLEQAGQQGSGGEKISEMALPTLIGLDGRRAVPAFTCVSAMQQWRRDARPVPAAALQVWQAAVGDSCAVVIDVGGPVPLAVEGARLAALARGEDPPEPWDDPDVREAVAGVLAGRLEVAAFELRPGSAESDMAIALSLAPGHQTAGAGGLASQVAEAVLDRLGGRLRRGVAIRLGAGR